MKLLLVGTLPPDLVAAILVLHFLGVILERVREFKCLGLVFMGQVDFGWIVDARLVTAWQTWHVLRIKFTALGWKDRGSKLLLFEAFVWSVLLYGSPASMGAFGFR